NRQAATTSTEKQTRRGPALRTTRAVASPGRSRRVPGRQELELVRKVEGETLDVRTWIRKRSPRAVQAACPPSRATEARARAKFVSRRPGGGMADPLAEDPSGIPASLLTCDQQGRGHAHRCHGSSDRAALKSTSAAASRR